MLSNCKAKKLGQFETSSKRTHVTEKPFSSVFLTNRKKWKLNYFCASDAFLWHLHSFRQLDNVSVFSQSIWNGLKDVRFNWIVRANRPTFTFYFFFCCCWCVAIESLNFLLWKITFRCRPLLRHFLSRCLGGRRHVILLPTSCCTCSTRFKT